MRNPMRRIVQDLYLLPITLLALTLLFAAGCQSSQAAGVLVSDAVLPSLTNEQRAAYRNTLQVATDAYDRNWNRDGTPRVEDADPEDNSDEDASEASDDPVSRADNCLGFYTIASYEG